MQSLILSIFLFSTVLTSSVLAGANCFLSDEDFFLAHSRLKTQVICSNAQSLKTCHDLVLVRSQKQEAHLPKVCKNKEIQIASTLPIATPLLISFNHLGTSLNKKLNRRTHVNSVVDFHHHTKMHKRRVVELGLRLAEKFPKDFKGLSKELITRVLSQHDNAKINPKYRYGKGTPFYEALYKYYGKVPPKDIINNLNKIDEEIIQRALKKEGLQLSFNDTKKERLYKTSLREKLFKLEKISDFVDRSMSEVSPEEFGRKMWKESSVPGEQKKIQMALYLERNYQRLVGHLEYKKLSAKEYFLLAQKIKIDNNFKHLLNSGRTLKELSKRSLDGITKVIGSSSVGNAAKIGGRIALGASLALDGILLATYSPSVGCSSMPGFHDWAVVNGKCEPVSGLTSKFIGYLDLPVETQKLELEFGSHMCKVVQNNLKINTENIFKQISCSPGGARLEVAKGKSVDVSYDFHGNISKIKLNNLKSYMGGIVGKSYNELSYNQSGELNQLCYKGTRGVEVCRGPDSKSTVTHTNNVTNFIGSINYKIQQGIGCCLGVKNDHNQNTICTI
jgi:hypothetical protein